GGPAPPPGGGGEREQAPAVIPDVDRVAAPGGAGGDLVAGVVDPPHPVRGEVERVDVPVPRSEEVETVPDQGRRFDRRADAPVPEQPPIVAVEHPDMPVHAVDDEL